MRFNSVIFALSFVMASNVFCAGSSITVIENENEFDQLFQEMKKPLVVQFHSGCPICNTTRTHLQEIAPNYCAKIKFVEVNIIVVPEPAQRYNITALPTVLIFKPGSKEPMYTIVGPNKEILSMEINKTLESLETK